MNLNKRLGKKIAIITVSVATVTLGVHHVGAAQKEEKSIDTMQVVSNDSFQVVSNNTIQVVSNEQKTITKEKKDTTIKTAPNLESNQLVPQKDETVYAFLNADGTIKETIVSDWLKNMSNSETLEDKSILSNIENVKGEETYALDAEGKLTWSASGSDIYYRGTSSNSLPIEVKTTYLLDGKEILAEELAGKSGIVTIRYDYKSLLQDTVTLNGKEEIVYTPFVVLSGSILPANQFTNVSVVNGKIISDGNNQIVVGYGIPGLEESLQLDSDIIDIPSYFEITAHVTDFSLGTTMMVALPDVFSNLSLDSVNNVEELQNSILKLVDGSEQLMDGSKQLYDGLLTLSSKVNEFSEGVATVERGMHALADGSISLKNGASTLSEGTKSLEDGAASLMQGLKRHIIRG